MTIPRAPLVLGLFGRIPYIWGAATLVSSDLAEWGAGLHVLLTVVVACGLSLLVLG